MEHRRPSIMGPLILITIGVLFLLANLGMLPFTIWEVAFRFWPLILILIGLEIIFGRRSMAGALVVLVLWIAIIAGAIWLAYAQGNGLLANAGTSIETISQPLSDVKSATVDLNIGVATTTVGSLGTDSGDLMNGTFQHAQGTQVVKKYDVVGGEGRLALSEQGNGGFTFGATSVSRWDLKLNPAVPLVLRVNGGVGRATMDLSSLSVTSLALDAGVGSLTVTAPKTGTVTVRLNGGVGSTTVVIPQDVAARIRVSRGLGRVQIPENRFPKFGDVYQSTDYATAANKIDIDLDGGIGGIEIR